MNVKLAKIYIGQAEQMRSLGKFEEAEEKGDLAQELRIKAMLTSWVEYSEKYRKQWAWILKELYQQ